MAANITLLQELNPEITQLKKVFGAQKLAFKRHSNPSAVERIAHLDALKHALIRYQDELAAAISADYGHRSTDEFKFTEILFSLEGLKYCRKHVCDWMKPEHRHVSALNMPAKAKVVYQPLGVVGVIVPWNYPVFLAVGPLMYALAAGNRVMIKMSGVTPRLSNLFQKMIAETFAEDHVAVFTGSGEISAIFPSLSFDQLTFTGSTEVGRIVMAEASKNLTPLLLELGGKSPTIVHKSYSMGDAAERIAFGKCLNAGQSCIAPDHLYLPRGKTKEFVQEFSMRIAKMYPSLLKNPDYSTVINDKQYQRIQSYLDDARAKGAQIIEINPANETFVNTRKMPVTLVTGLKLDMLLMRHEIFGPVLPILEYDDLDELLKLINSRARPLALYYFDNSTTRADYVIENTHSGGVTVNDVVTHVAIDDLPFGGVGSAGMGRYHGHEGFKSMSNTKGVLIKSRLYTLHFILPPFNKAMHALIKKYLLNSST